MTETRDLVSLAAAWTHAKRMENNAKCDRLAVEEAIIAITGFKKPEGQESFECDNTLGYCKVVLKQSIQTSIDSQGWLTLRRTLTKEHPGRQIFKSKFSLETKLARQMQDNFPKEWAEVSSVITRKPGKISIDVKEVTITNAQKTPDEGQA